MTEDYKTLMDSLKLKYFALRKVGVTNINFDLHSQSLYWTQESSNDPVIGEISVLTIEQVPTRVVKVMSLHNKSKVYCVKI